VAALDQGPVTICYVDHHGQATDTYPWNPNGSPLGVTGLTHADGRVTILMAPPERCFLRRQYPRLPRGRTRRATGSGSSRTPGGGWVGRRFGMSNVAPRIDLPTTHADGCSMVSWQARAPVQTHTHGIIYLTIPT
jgi:hypothetical protein